MRYQKQRALYKGRRHQVRVAVQHGELDRHNLLVQQELSQIAREIPRKVAVDPTESGLSSGSSKASLPVNSKDSGLSYLQGAPLGEVELLLRRRKGDSGAAVVDHVVASDTLVPFAGSSFRGRGGGRDRRFADDRGSESRI